MRVALPSNAEHLTLLNKTIRSVHMGDKIDAVRHLIGCWERRDIDACSPA